MRARSRSTPDRNDGIKVDQTVINGDGLVGRVIEVGPTTATILLLTDPTFTVGARMAGSLEIGAVTGQGVDPLALELFNPQARARSRRPARHVGQSRKDRPFVPGVPIGEVIAVTPTPGALDPIGHGRPFANLTALRSGRRGRRTAAQGPARRVLPRRPRPAPT